MTTRWKRLTALMLILLTLLNAGSALAAEEFWKWGDVYEEKLILGQPAKVTSLQVFKDELYFVYGDLLLKCHDPESTPETVYELKNLVAENVYPILYIAPIATIGFLRMAMHCIFLYRSCKGFIGLISRMAK